MKEKLIKIIIPYILISTTFMLIYSLFYWFLFIRLKLSDLNDNIFGFFVPIGISTVLILFYFRKKLQLLNTTDKYREFTLFISWILLTAPILTFQFYLERETGELTKLENVDEILSHKPTMYYSIDKSFQHKNKSSSYVVKGFSDRGNEIGVARYFVCPLSNIDATINNKNIWIGVMFGEHFSNRVLDNKKEQERLISKFIDSSITLYNKYKYTTKYLKRLSSEDEKDGYLQAIQQTNLSHNDDNLIILKEELGSYKSRTGTSLWWTYFTFIASNVVWIVLTIFPKLKKTKTQ